MEVSAREREVIRPRTAERSARGGGSYIQTSENLFQRCIGSADERRCGANPGAPKALEETQAGLGDKSGGEDKAAKFKPREKLSKKGRRRL